MGSRRGESAASREVANALDLDEEGTHHAEGHTFGRPTEAVVWMRCCNNNCVFFFVFVLTDISTAARNVVILARSDTPAAAIMNNDYESE